MNINIYCYLTIYTLKMLTTYYEKLEDNMDSKDEIVHVF